MKKIYKIEIVFDDEKEMLEWTKGQSVKPIQDIPTLRIQDRRKNETWTHFEDEEVISNYYKHPVKYIAKALGRTTQGVNQRVFKLKQQGLLKNKIRRNGKVQELINHPHLVKH